VFREVTFRVENLNNLMFYVVVLWMRRDYIPDVGLKWESPTSMTWMRSQDGGCSHSKREKSVHVDK